MTQLSYQAVAGKRELFGTASDSKDPSTHASFPTRAGNEEQYVDAAYATRHGMSPYDQAGPSTFVFDRSSNVGLKKDMSKMQQIYGGTDLSISHLEQRKTKGKTDGGDLHRRLYSHQWSHEEDQWTGALTQDAIDSAGGKLPDASGDFATFRSSAVSGAGGSAALMRVPHTSGGLRRDPKVWGHKNENSSQQNMLYDGISQVDDLGAAAAAAQNRAAQANAQLVDVSATLDQVNIYGADVRIYRHEQLQYLSHHSLVRHMNHLADSLRHVDLHLSMPRTRAHEEIVRWVLATQAHLLLGFYVHPGDQHAMARIEGVENVEDLIDENHPNRRQTSTLLRKLTGGEKEDRYSDCDAEQSRNSRQAHLNAGSLHKPILQLKKLHYVTLPDDHPMKEVARLLRKMGAPNSLVAVEVRNPTKPFHDHHAKLTEKAAARHMIREGEYEEMARASHGKEYDLHKAEAKYDGGAAGQRVTADRDYASHTHMHTFDPTAAGGRHTDYDRHIHILGEHHAVERGAAGLSGDRSQELQNLRNKMHVSSPARESHFTRSNLMDRCEIRANEYKLEDQRGLGASRRHFERNNKESGAFVVFTPTRDLASDQALPFSPNYRERRHVSPSRPDGFPATKYSNAVADLGVALKIRGDNLGRSGTELPQTLWGDGRRGTLNEGGEYEIKGTPGASTGRAVAVGEGSVRGVGGSVGGDGAVAFAGERGAGSNYY